MSQPDVYTPAHSFVADSANIPDFPGQNIDVELAAIAAVFAEYHTNIALIQRDDGALANGIVTAESLDTVLAAGLGDLASLATVQALVTTATAAATTATADVVLTHADVVLTHADVVLTHADVITTAASAAAAAVSATAAANASAAVAFKYTWSTSTSGDPGTGKIAVNNAAPGSATALQISETDANTNAISAEIARWDDNVATAGRCRLKISKDATNFLLLTITSAITDAGTYDTYTVSGASLTGTLANGDTVYVQPTTNGADGAGSVSGGTNHGVAIMSGATAIATSIVLGNTQILIGQTGADPTANTVSGDITINATGVTAIGAGKVTLAMIASAAYAAAATASLLVLRDASANLTTNAFIEGYTTTATATGTTTLTVTSTPVQFFTGTLAQTLVLPVTSTLALGFRYKVVNNSTLAVTVQSSGANNILVLGPQSEAEFVCILTTGTTAASWYATQRYVGIPQNSQSAAYTTVLSDAGKHLYHPGADTTARVWTIDSNANVPYTIGTAITFINDTSGGVITISITSDTLVLAGLGTTGSRTLAANGIATAVKMTSTRWIISGTGLT